MTMTPGSRQANQGDVVFLMRPNVDDPKYIWHARMRDHSGWGATAEEAALNLVLATRACYEKAQAALASLERAPDASAVRDARLAVNAARRQQRRAEQAAK